MEKQTPSLLMEKQDSRIICQWKVRKKKIEIIFERVVYAVAFINVINKSNIEQHDK